jgi:glucokinase
MFMFSKESLDCVCAMGTGLGTGVIRYNPKDGFSVLTLEGGHCKATFPGRKAENRETDMKRLEYLSQVLYQSKHSIEFEDICSGRGLQSCYEFEVLNKKDEPKTMTSGESRNLFILNAIV